MTDQTAPEGGTCGCPGVTATVSLVPEPPAMAAGFSDLDALVAALLPKSSASDWNAVAAFMGAVVPWPVSAKDAGWVIMPNGYPDKDSSTGRLRTGKYPIAAGRAFKTIDEFINFAGWAIQQHFYKDLFFCLSLQRHVATTRGGKPKGKRTASGAISLKAIWLDIDVGKSGAYGTVEEALKAVIDFQQRNKLPPFSAIVGSGGGIHVYWISKTAMSPDEWRPYAEGLKALAARDGLKCDLGVTTDAARILRLPGTFNHKEETPRPCQLFNAPLALYEFQTRLAILLQVPPLWSGSAHNRGSSETGYSPFADGANMSSFKGAPILEADPNDRLDAGIDKYSDALIDPRPIFKHCGFYRNALANGGKDYGQQLWMYTVLGTTFMENGRVYAHEISKGHATYSPADTDAMFDRKLADRTNRGIGYPGCAAISGAGCKACPTCPLLARGKSPLNIRPDAPDFTATANTEAGDAPPADQSFVDPFAEFVGPEFPLDILSPTLAAFVDAQHRAMGADPAAVAMAALSAAAGAIHAETQVRAGDSWWEKPTLWTGLVGYPSSMKSPIIEKATKPLSRIDHERDKRWRQAQKTWAQSPNKKTTASPPKQARCIINDATPEKVAELLSRDPSGALMVHDELAGWLGSFERYSAGQSSRALYLTSWNGGTFLKDRVGNGKNDLDAEVRVDNLALCILGGIQPDRLIKLGDLTSDGLLQRFLAVLMKPAQLGDPDHPVEVAEAKYEKLINSINALPPQNYFFADDASEVRDDVLRYLYELEQVDGFSPALIGAIGKLKGYFARICLVLHVVQTQDDPRVRPEINFILADAFRNLDPSESLSAGVNVNVAIPHETAEAAKKLLLEFLLPHMIGLYDVVVNGGQERDKLQAIANFILASDKDRLRPSDFRAGVRTLRGEPEQKIRDWVGRFCGMDWLTPEEIKPGAPAKAWQVALGLRDHFTERRKQAQAARAEMHAILKNGGSKKSR